MDEYWVDRKRNEYIRGSIGIAYFVNKIRNNRLGWFGHVMKREKSEATRMVMKINIGAEKKREDWKRNGWMQLRVIWVLLVCV